MTQVHLSTTILSSCLCVWRSIPFPRTWASNHINIPVTGRMWSFLYPF